MTLAQPSVSSKISPKLSVEAFLDSYPDDGRYELINGEMVRILATRHHEDIADFIAKIFDREVDRLSLNYRISGRIAIITTGTDGTENVRHPDVSVVNRDAWRANRSAYYPIATEPLQLAVEVVSTNWEDDYVDKLAEYQRLGITEYWVIDYLAIASRSYLGNPKQPSVFVHWLNAEGIYQAQQFRGEDRITSTTFPELTLTVNQILEA
ncbi:Putative restriction endonuclease domain-containing protein [Tumidithrix helvetica PCC 7403]|uniref:Uma2 family endonuclease n=1 Tax=Tumidithrix helvetica TaxID=3457545 RepID=UPI003C92A318